MRDSTKRFLGIDLGASSGRILEYLKIVRLEEVYSFPNRGVQVFDALYWDNYRFLRRLKEG